MNASSLFRPTLFSAALLVAAAVAEAACPQPPQIKEGIKYKSYGTNDVYMQATYPKNWKKSDSRPAFLAFYGGSWVKRCWDQDTAAQFGLRDRYDFVLFRVDYRVTKSIEDSIWRDVRSAVRYVRKHAAEFGVDPNRIVVGGGSAGGEITVASAMYTDRNEPTEDLSVSGTPDYVLSWVPAFGGGPNDFHGIRDDLPPMLLMSGGNDDWYKNPGAAKDWYAAAKAWNADVNAHVLPGGGHGVHGSAEQFAWFYDKADKFLEKYAVLGNRVSRRPFFQVTLTAPKNNQDLPGGAVTFSADAKDAGNGEVAKKVEFYVDTLSTPVAVDESAPFSVTWNAPAGYHKVHAVGIFASGERRRSERLGFNVGGGAKPAVMYVQRIGEFGASEKAMADRLQKLGFATTRVEWSNYAEAANAALVVYSSQTNRAPMPTYMTTPVFSVGYRYLASFSHLSGDTTNQVGWRGKDTLVFTPEAASTPLSGGKTGRQAISDQGINFPTNVKAGGGAVKLATVAQDPSLSPFFAFEKGALLPEFPYATSIPSPGRKLVFFTPDLHRLNAYGASLFDSSVLWLTGASAAKLPVSLAGMGKIEGAPHSALSAHLAARRERGGLLLQAPARETPGSAFRLLSPKGRVLARGTWGPASFIAGSFEPGIYFLRSSAKSYRVLVE